MPDPAIPASLKAGKKAVTENRDNRVRPLCLMLLLVMTLIMGGAARAADITVFSPGIANGPLRTLAANWQARTGNKVTITGGNVGRIRAAVESDTPADLVLAPTPDLADLSPRLVGGSGKPVGRIIFGIVVKAGGAHPDISTREEFVAFAKKAGVLAYANPAVGSLSGGMVEKMLKTPEFAGVKGLPIKGMIGNAVVRGDAAYGAGAISEEKMAAGGEVIGRIPDSFGLFIDVSVAMLKVTKAPEAAADFLAYITSDEAAPVWTEGGIEKTP